MANTGLWAWKHPPQEDSGFDYVQLKGEVRFYDVDFGYNPDKTVLHDVSLYAEPGQKIAFVGATGAGKTTITNLINRFYDIADGKIRYDGININKIKKADLRRSLGIVLAGYVSLFTGTSRGEHPLRQARPPPTRKCYAAAQLANADGFIHLPARWVRHHAHRRRRQPLPGPAAAAVHCPGGGGRSAGA